MHTINVYPCRLYNTLTLAVLCEHAVQLTWMAYDMVVQRTSPEQGDMMLRLQDAYKRCKAFICREEDDSELNKEPQEDK